MSHILMSLAWQTYCMVIICSSAQLLHLAVL
jgi:hypothetical protein